MPKDLIDAAKVKAEMAAMVKLISHPEFVAAMKQMKETPVAGRRALGEKILTAEALRKKGVNIPAKMRLTTRYFEPGKPGILELKPDGTIRGTVTPRFPIETDRGPQSWGGCACGGGLSFCGGAGGST